MSCAAHLCHPSQPYSHTLSLALTFINHTRWSHSTHQSPSCTPAGHTCPTPACHTYCHICHVTVTQIRDRGLEDEPRFADIATRAGFLRAIRELLVVELAAEPCLRRTLRKVVYE